MQPQRPPNPKATLNSKLWPGNHASPKGRPLNIFHTQVHPNHIRESEPRPCQKPKPRMHIHATCTHIHDSPLQLLGSFRGRPNAVLELWCSDCQVDWWNRVILHPPEDMFATKTHQGGHNIP